jgi:CRISPR-associated protein Csd1
MILQKLAEYYDRLAADPDSDIAPFGFSRQKISFEVVLNPDGSLSALHDARRDDGGRQVPRMLVVPGLAKPSGSGINPGFLWDNAQYVLGFKADDPKPERTRLAFEAFRDRHVALEREIDDPAFTAVCHFLQGWQPENAASHPHLSEIAGSFGIFRLVGAEEYVHDRPAVLRYWRRQLAAASDTPRAPSLITGDVQPIARLHEPKIKGVRGAQSSGATLVGFNADAYESYGKSQSYNAPVGVDDAFKYCTALDRLTTRRDRQVHLGDTTVVCWADRPVPFEDELLGIFEDVRAEDQVTLDRVHGFLQRLRRAAGGGAIDEGDVPFYVLGLSPNAARLSVRFWLAGTVQQFAARLGQHLADLELVGAPPDMPALSLQRILDQTARERDDIHPLLSGAVLRAVLTGGPYPPMLASAVLRRLRADAQPSSWSTYARAAILKAYLTRKARIHHRQEIMLMALDTECPQAAYQLGRLFAALEKTQEDAAGRDVNVTIKDRYFSAASANPVAAFPRLLRLHAHHLNKLGTDMPGLRVSRERLVQEILSRLNATEGFPSHLPLDEQGLFFLGYYHQRHAFFAPRKDSTNATLNPQSASSAQED